MIHSIRKYILIYLGCSISVLLIFLVMVSNLYFDRKTIEQHLDSIMTISALTFNATIENLEPQKLIKLQRQFNHIYEYYNSNFEHIRLPHFSLQQYAQNFNIQILNDQGENLLHSNQEPLLPRYIIKRVGFHQLYIDHTPWRFFISKHPKLKIYTALGEKYSYRENLIRKIIKDDFLILLLIFPMSMALIWLTVSKSLLPLKQLTKAIKTRDPYHLKPVNLTNIPTEVQPLIYEINHLLERLQDALSREQAFAADAAHELRTPLATIKTFSQTGIELTPTPETRQVFEKIIQSVDRGSHVIQQLMNMSKTMPEALFLSKFQSLDLPTLCRETLSQMTQFALEKNMDIELETSSKLPKIQGNKISLEILIRNLIDNSIRYSSPNTPIFVSIYTAENSLVLEIRDQGPGIPKSKQAKVFDRFYRAHEPKYQGSGLGLAIVKQIANLHHAQITLETPHHTKGLIIRVFFPIKN